MTNQQQPEREIVFAPAWDRRDPDPHKDYGIHSVELRFFLRKPEAVIQFVVYTNWVLPQSRDSQYSVRHHYPFEYWQKPMPADIGYHSPKPMYEGQESLTESCEHLGGAPCYYDGSTMNAERIFERLISEGHDGVWAAMEEFYTANFETVAKVRGA